MGILLITLAGCFLILAIIMLIVWRKTDWKNSMKPTNSSTILTATTSITTKPASE